MRTDHPGGSIVTEPRTEAGRRALDNWTIYGSLAQEEAIRDIEDEAARMERERMAEWLRLAVRARFAHPMDVAIRESMVALIADAVAAFEEAAS
jgi:hypothetical protein